MMFLALKMLKMGILKPKAKVNIAETTTEILKTAVVLMVAKTEMAITATALANSQKKRANEAKTQGILNLS